jgi:hypothetical protein
MSLSIAVAEEPMPARQELDRPGAGHHRGNSGTGALTIVTGADRNELEVEISPAGSSGPRTRDIVHAHRTGARVVYSAMFPSVPVGEYVVWHDESAPAGTVVVRGGEVGEYHLI